MKKIVLLTNTSELAVYVANKMAQKIEINSIVVDRKISKHREIFSIERCLVKILGKKYYLKLVMFFKFLFMDKEEKIIYKLEQKLEKEAINTYLKDIKLFKKFSSRTFFVDNINSNNCIKFLEKEKPDILITFGTSILKNKVISIPKNGIINIHFSMLPYYRGSLSEFWQLYYDDYESVGVTLHYIDEGIDTGNIIVQRKTTACNKDNFFTLRCKNINTFISLFNDEINNIIDDKIKSIPQHETNDITYRWKMITKEKKIEFYNKKNLL